MPNCCCCVSPPSSPRRPSDRRGQPGTRISWKSRVSGRVPGCVRRRAPGHQTVRAVRGPVAAADRGAAQRAGTGDDSSARPRQGAGRGQWPRLANPQILWTLVGVAAFALVVICSRTTGNSRATATSAGSPAWSFLAIPALLPRSLSEQNGAKIWIRLPGFSIQPAEFSKILLLIFFSAVLVAKRGLFTSAGKHVLGMDLPRPRDLAPLLAAWVASIAVMVFEKDLGTSLLLYASFLVVVYLATQRFSWVVIGLALFAWEALRRTSFSITSGFACRPGWTRSPTPTAPATRSCSRCSVSPPAASSAPAWATGNPTPCRPRRPISSSPRSAKNSAWSGWPAC